MTSTPQESETSNAFPLWLDGSIQLLDIASSVCSFAPAQVALGSACALLKMIKVRSLQFFDEEHLSHVHLGHQGQRRGLYLSRTVLRPCV